METGIINMVSTSPWGFPMCVGVMLAPHQHLL